MITVKEDTALVGISELRTHIEEILEESKKHKIVIGRRNKPVAVLLDMEKYNQMEHALELLEDFVLGFLAKERDSKTKSSEYVDIERALQSLQRK